MRVSGAAGTSASSCTPSPPRARDTGVVFGARGDPGYAATAVMMGESALALVVERAALPAAAGVLTPATGIGPVLAARLRAAGFEIAVDRNA